MHVAAADAKIDLPWAMGFWRRAGRLRRRGRQPRAISVKPLSAASFKGVSPLGYSARFNFAPASRSVRATNFVLHLTARHKGDGPCLSAFTRGRRRVPARSGPYPLRAVDGRVQWSAGANAVNILRGLAGRMQRDARRQQSLQEFDVAGCRGGHKQPILLRLGGLHPGR